MSDLCCIFLVTDILLPGLELYLFQAIIFITFNLYLGKRVGIF